MKTIQIKNNTRPLVSPIQIGYCSSFFRRGLGLMFRSKLSTDGGLLLVQPRESRMDSSIHMLFVFMDLAVVWISNDLTVVDTALARAWRPAYLPRKPARYILEINPIRMNDFLVGDRLEFLDA